MSDALDRLTEIERQIVRALREIRFGSVEITVHDARVVQIERREKVRVSDRTSS